MLKTIFFLVAELIERCGGEDSDSSLVEAMMFLPGSDIQINSKKQLCTSGVQINWQRKFASFCNVDVSSGPVKTSVLKRHYSGSLYSSGK